MYYYHFLVKAVKAHFPEDVWVQLWYQEDSSVNCSGRQERKVLWVVYASAEDFVKVVLFLQSFCRQYIEANSCI